MEKRGFLIYILGYLNGLNSTNKISSGKISKISELIAVFRAEEERINGYSNQDDYEENYQEEDTYDHNSLYNNPNYDPESDLDQQGPDFDF